SVTANGANNSSPCQFAPEVFAMLNRSVSSSLDGVMTTPLWQMIDHLECGIPNVVKCGSVIVVMVFHFLHWVGLFPSDDLQLIFCRVLLRLLVFEIVGAAEVIFGAG